MRVDPEVLALVANGTIDQGLVPLENAIEGTVSATIDGLVFDHDLLIEEEIVLPIHLHLLARPGVKLEEIDEGLELRPRPRAVPGIPRRSWTAS